MHFFLLNLFLEISCFDIIIYWRTSEILLVHFPYHHYKANIGIKWSHVSCLISQCNTKAVLTLHCSLLVVVQSLSCVRLFATPWTAALQAPLSSTISRNLLKLMSIESVMPSHHLIICHPLLILPSIFPSIRFLNTWKNPQSEAAWVWGFLWFKFAAEI